MPPLRHEVVRRLKYSRFEQVQGIWTSRTMTSKGAVAANFHENTTVEIVWTVIPLIIVILMVVPATKTVVAMQFH